MEKPSCAVITGLGSAGWFVKSDWPRMTDTIDVNISAQTHFSSLALPTMMTMAAYMNGAAGK